jgi:hypothetical protein
MKLVPASLVAQPAARDGEEHGETHHGHGHAHHAAGHGGDAAAGIEGKTTWSTSTG